MTIHPRIERHHAFELGFVCIVYVFGGQQLASKLHFQINKFEKDRKRNHFNEITRASGIGHRFRRNERMDEITRNELSPLAVAGCCD